MDFVVRFWGVRGSIACPSPYHVRYGGNTSCLSFSMGDRHLILDAGTGIRGLGQYLQKQDVKEATILLTHTHWDHINGFPFFAPAFVPGRSFRILAGHLIGAGGIQEVLNTQMHTPMFPVPLDAMRARLEFEDFASGENFRLAPDITVRTCPLNHPNGATGYRVEYGGKSACYITDTEHTPGKPDATILALIEGADLVIYDSTYTDDEFPAKVGWGHSTWQEGVRLCRMANVKRMAVFHHDPDHDDDFMDALGAEAKAVWPGCFVARESEPVVV
ncbi:MBL fold metallo-hydrolase [Oleispirillum naphthae]|uniref:MBL fold metallo-hydrolase n=1 Tax=Oleispirillum naphthae TaxID=2838853 RepID=UPI0030824021